MSIKTNNLIEDWVYQHSDSLYNFCLIRVQNTDTAKDLVQDTFLAAQQKISTFKGNSSPKTWLHSILKNKILDYYKKSSTQKEINLKESYNDYDENDHFFETLANKNGTWNNQAAPNNWNIDYNSKVESDEFYDILHTCLGKLPEKWKNVFLLKNIEGYKSDEICKELQISSSNYWVIMHRTKLQLRECLEINWVNS